MKIIYGMFLLMLLATVVFFAADGEIFWALGSLFLLITFSRPLAQYFSPATYGDHEKIVSALTAFQSRSTNAYSNGQMTGNLTRYWQIKSEWDEFESSIETVPGVGTEWGGGQQYRYKRRGT